MRDFHRLLKPGPLPVLLLAALLIGFGAGALRAAGTVHVIEMVDRQYKPQAITAKRGDTLLFVNRDQVAHYVFSPTADYAVDLRNALNGPVSNDHTHLPGDQVPLELRKAVAFRIECGLHPEMLLAVTVQP